MIQLIINPAADSCETEADFMSALLFELQDYPMRVDDTAFAYPTEDADYPAVHTHTHAQQS